jgi:branched-chain amino acid transport system ATP-binding protein
MINPILEVRDLCKHFGGIAANDGVNLTIADGKIHALIGPNGCGKTTLISQIMGNLIPDRGSVRFRGRDISRMAVHTRARLGLGRSWQNPSLFPDFTAAENVAFGLRASQGLGHQFWRPATSLGLRDQAHEILFRVGIPFPSDNTASNLSHGDQRKLDLAITLSSNPTLVLLDEPLAGLEADECAEMLETICAIKNERTIILVEHNMDAVFALADRITVLFEGRVLASGTPSAIRGDLRVQSAYLGDT